VKKIGENLPKLNHTLNLCNFMIKDYLIIDNIFENPKKIIEFSQNIKYYHSSQSNKPEGNWVGLRSDRIYELDNSFFNSLFNEIFSKCFAQFKVTEFQYRVNSYFHILPSEFVFNETWLHIDNNYFLAGVVYLNEDPPKETGTILTLNDEVCAVENKFNRLVMYNSSIKHAPQNSFDYRLTLTFFIEELCIKG